jgi:hypothetical protein
MLHDSVVNFFPLEKTIELVKNAGNITNSTSLTYLYITFSSTTDKRRRCRELKLN